MESCRANSTNLRRIRDDNNIEYYLIKNTDLKMETFIDIAIIVGAILSLILFFKIWGMCNDIRTLREKYAPKVKEQFESDKDIEKWLNEDPDRPKKRKNII